MDGQREGTAMEEEEDEEGCLTSTVNGTRCAKDNYD